MKRFGHWLRRLTLPSLVAITPCFQLAAAEEYRGEPNAWRGMFGIALLLVGPLFGGIFLALVQLGVYNGLAKVGAIKKENIPIFPVFLLRGMIMLVALIAATMFWLKISGRALPFSLPT